MYHLWRVPDLEAAARKLAAAGCHPGGGVLVPFRGKTYLIANEGSYLPGMKRTWIVAERVAHGIYRPRSSFVTRPRTPVTAGFLEHQLMRAEWPDARPVRVDAEEYGSHGGQAA